MGGQEAWANNKLGLSGAPDAWDDVPIYVPAETAHPRATLSRNPTLIAPDIGSTGVLPYAEVFPLSLFSPIGGEQAIVIHVAGKGLVVVTGRGHPGLENTVIRAKALYRQPVVGVVGGLHCGQAKSETLAGHIEFVQSQQIQWLAMSPHDSGPEALATFASALPDGFHTLQVG